MKIYYISLLIITLCYIKYFENRFSVSISKIPINLMDSLFSSLIYYQITSNAILLFVLMGFSLSLKSVPKVLSFRSCPNSMSALECGNSCPSESEMQWKPSFRGKVIYISRVVTTNDSRKDKFKTTLNWRDRNTIQIGCSPQYKTQSSVIIALLFI